MKRYYTIESAGLVLDETKTLAAAFELALAAADEMGVNVDVYTHVPARSVITATAMPGGELEHFII